MAFNISAATRNSNRFLLHYSYSSLSLRTGVALPSINRTCGETRANTRTFSSSALRKDFHFDTHHFVQRLEREGLTRAQAEGVMNSISEVIDESIRTMTRNMVTKLEHEKVTC